MRLLLTIVLSAAALLTLAKRYIPQVTYTGPGKALAGPSTNSI